MRPLTLIASALSCLALAGCPVAREPQAPIAPGGSVIDMDRGTSGAYSPSTGSPAGAENTIGVASTGWQRDVVAYGERVAEVTPGPIGVLIAGPPQAERPLSDPDTIRAIQTALQKQGYYHGPLNGQADATLVDAIGRFQGDRGLPITGRLDDQTAKALGVTLPTPPPPHTG